MGVENSSKTESPPNGGKKKASTKPTKLLRKQKAMRRVLTGLTPCLLAAIYFFGWRCLAIVALSCATAFVVEYLFCRWRGEPVSEACFVTGAIFGLIMPPTVPWHVVIFGVGFAIMFAKEIFGGFGHNVFNPAMAGRCFVYVCFPVALTSTWAPAAEGPWGALDRWSTTPTADAVTAATPLSNLKAQTDDPKLTVSRLITGRLAGTMGATSVVAIFIGGLYVLLTKTANWMLTITVTITFLGFNGLLYLFGAPGSHGFGYEIFYGAFWFLAFFMITDPVSAPKTKPARIGYAVIAGVAGTVIRKYSVFNAGLMFGLLIANMFASILDVAVQSRQERQKAAAATEQGS